MKTPKVKSFIQKNQNTLLITGSAVLLTAIILAVRAADPFATFEAEGSILNGNALVKSDTAASGGKYVEFTTGSSTPPPPSTPTDGPWKDAGPTNRSLFGSVKFGSITITESDTVLENFERNGTIFIDGAKNVTIRNCHVYKASFWTIRVYNGGSLNIEHCEIGHASFKNERGIGGSNITARYLDIHDVEDGIKAGSNTLYEFNYVHDLDSPNTNPHGDAVQFDGGASNAVIRQNYLDARRTGSFGNAAMFIKSDLGPINNVLVEGNYLNGGNWKTYVYGGPGVTAHPFPSGVRIINNTIGPDHNFGEWAFKGGVPEEVSGNVRVDGTDADPF